MSHEILESLLDFIDCNDFASLGGVMELFQKCRFISFAQLGFAPTAATRTINQNTFTLAEEF